MSPVAQPIPLLLVADSAETCERIASALLSAPAFYRIERMTSPDLNQKGPPSDIRLAGLLTRICGPPSWLRWCSG